MCFVALAATMAQGESPTVTRALLGSTKTTSELVTAVGIAPSAARFYTSQFGLSDTELRVWLRSLEPSRLAHSTKVEEYFAGADGGTASKTVDLPTGSRVYVDVSGHPVLNAEDGNPIAASTAKPSTGGGVAAGGSEGSLRSLETPVSAAAADALSMEPKGPVLTESAISSVQPNSLVQVEEGAGGNSIMGGLLAAGAFGAELYTGIHQNNVDPGGHGTPAVAPEPGSILVIGVGLAGLYGRKKKKLKQTR